MLNYLRVFIKVVEKGSFSKAADVLHMAPSSVARNIDSLEKELNTCLFERSTRQLKLTDKGLTLFDGAQKIITDADHLKSALSNNKFEVEGRLRISAFESFGRLYICPLIPDFLNQYPKVDIEIELENKVVDLFSEDIDVAIRVGEPQDSQLKARKLLSNHTLICASPGYLKKYGEPTTPDDLQKHNCLLLSSQRQRTYWHFKKGNKNSKVPVNGNLKSKGGTPLFTACHQGLGIIQISNWMVAESINSGNLVALLTDWESNLNESTSGDVYAVYKPRTYPNPLVRVFIDYLVRAC